MIVATAGHIDHGKTTLVKALTGVDTDRLPQEKARGISIDIGFAYWPSPSGDVIGFVDVPGHERFIHNMLAGVACIDAALLVVAADDGVMPQTREHLGILDLLGVSAGLVALTKVDRVGPERAAEAAAEVGALLAGTGLAGAAIIPVASVTGQGLPALRQELAAIAARLDPHARAGRSFRFCVDRSFSAAGSGTVVTGTVLDGEVAVGDRLYVSPAGLPVRVRGLHQQGRAVERARAGERAAINIAGADPAAAARGTWLLAPNAHAPTQRLDARVRLLAGERKPLRHWDPVHLHIGTLDTLARVVRPEGPLAPGASGTLQLVTDKPVAAAIDDHFVLRDASARRTIGGGTVVDPFARHPRGRREARASRIAALQDHEPGHAWDLLLREPAGVAVQDFRRTFNLTPAAMRDLLERSGAALPAGEQGTAYSAEALTGLQLAVTGTLRGFHSSTPQAAGMDTDRLLRSALPRVAHREAIAVLRAMAQAGLVEVHGSLVRLAGHVVAERPADAHLWAKLGPLYEQWGAQVPLLREVAARSGIEEPRLRELLKHRVVLGDMVRIAPDRFLPRSQLASLAQAVVDVAGRSGDEFTLGAFRDVAGIGRNLAIEVLEWFDRLGLTRRGPDGRTIRCLDSAVAAAMREPGWRAPRFTGAESSN